MILKDVHRFKLARFRVLALVEIIIQNESE